MLPHALTSAEIIFRALGKKALAGWVGPAALMTGALSDVIMTVDLVLNRNLNAALGCGMMAASGVALTWVALGGGGALGLATLGTPVTAALFVMVLTGFVVYLSWKDSDIERYLKNGLWSVNGRESRQAILSASVDCFSPVTAKEAWQSQRQEVQEYMQKFFPVGIKLFVSEQHVYVGLSMPFAQPGSKVTLEAQCVFCDRSSIELHPEKDVVGEAIEEQVNGLHLFDLCFDRDRLLKMNNAKMSGADYYDMHIFEARLKVRVSYHYSADIAYDSIDAQIIISSLSSPDPVAEARLQALLANAGN
jgi:hypothetical protein